MHAFQAFILGMVQGITEFLPISSSAHLVLVPWFFGWKDPGLAFDVFLHLGTLLAIVGYFFKDWWRLLSAGIASVVERRIGFDPDRVLFWQIVAATIPTLLIGFLLHDKAEAEFRSPLLIAVALALVGFLMYWIDGNYPSLRQLPELRITDAVLIGLAQGCALVPGVSRSGSTMTMARLRGFNREAAARFSFLLSVPITFAAEVFKFRDIIATINQTAASQVSSSYLWVGFVSSFVFGVLAIHFLLMFLRFADFKIFAWYRILLAAIVVLFSVFGRG